MKKIDKKNIEDIFALTPMQEGMLFHYLKDPQGKQYFEQLSLNISGNIDITTFKKAWDFVIETNEMLRTVFRWENVKNPIQIVLKQQNLNFEYHDISNKHNNEKEKLLEEIKSNDRKRKFDLHEVPFRITLCKIEIDRYEIIISNHHILYDGWSNGIILKEFFKVYENIITKKSIRKTKKNKFKEFVQLVNNDDKEKQRRYWKRYLNGFDTRTELAFKKKNRSEKIIDGKNEVILKNDLKINMDEFVKKYKLSIALILYCAWGILLQKYNDSDDVVFGTTVSGRSVKVKGIEEMIGLFINSLPLRINTNPDEKIINLLNRINRFLKDRQEFESSSLVNIKEYCELDNRVELFDSLVIIENYPLDRTFIKNNKLTVKSYSMFELTNYDLSVGIMIFNDIKIIFNYNKTLFDEESINKISNHFIRIIKEIILCTGKKVSDIELI